jgi:16S rRNA (cytidine1402-2'-O)-methyltransferase
MSGRLILAATPIGDVDDASARLRRVLESADVIAAEDTRRLKRLVDSLGAQIRASVVAYHDAVERERLPKLLEQLRGGALVVLVTDAGMPSVSDPGYRIVEAAAAEGIAVTVVPGPSAVTTALAVSGLAVDRFCFEGFLPRKGGERATRFAELADERRTMVFFESPHRIQESLESALAVLGPDRQATVSRELTKKFEHTERGTLAQLVEWAKTEPKGEMVIVIAGAIATEHQAIDVIDQVLELVAAGSPLKPAVAQIAEAAGVSKSELYDLVLQKRKQALN